MCVDVCVCKAQNACFRLVKSTVLDFSWVDILLRLMLMMWWFVLTEQFGCMLTDRGKLPDAGHPFHLQRVPGGHDILADLQHHGRPVLLG